VRAEGVACALPCSRSATFIFPVEKNSKLTTTLYASLVVACITESLRSRCAVYRCHIACPASASEMHTMLATMPWETYRPSSANIWKGKSG